LSNLRFLRVSEKRQEQRYSNRQNKSYGASS
jgi:hypothetical protein